MSFIAIDFEASCLPRFGRSFPIEVGIAAPDGWSRSWLIRPHAQWRDWQWSDDAQALHGLTPDRLQREGLDAASVAAQLREAVAGGLLVADSVLDDYWSRTLFDAAGEADHLAVTSLAALPRFHAVDPERLQAAVASADRHRLNRHRAADDARWLAGLIADLDIIEPADASAPKPPAQAASRRPADVPLQPAREHRLFRFDQDRPLTAG